MRLTRIFVKKKQKNKTKKPKIFIIDKQKQSNLMQATLTIHNVINPITTKLMIITIITVIIIVIIKLIKIAKLAKLLNLLIIMKIKIQLKILL